MRVTVFGEPVAVGYGHDGVSGCMELLLRDVFRYFDVSSSGALPWPIEKACYWR